jgi:hypothetical protein
MPIPPLIYLDRYCNEGTRTYSIHADYSEAEVKYRPNADHPNFEVAVYEVPKKQMLVYRTNPSQTLVSKYLGDNRVAFCIHPQMLEYGKDDPYIRRTLSMGARTTGIPVAPSSSTRTLYVLDHKAPHALKVHFPFRISRYGRKMRHEVLEQAIAVSAELEQGISQLDDRFAFLREVIGVAHENLRPNSDRGENWGYLVRDMRPFPHVGEDRPLIPGFALYGKDFFDPRKPPLLFELIGDRNPLSYVLEEIMLPIIRHWVACFLTFGYLLEPHGQNVLLEIDGAMHCRRIVHRDLSIGIDMRRRRDIGLSDGRLNAYNRMENSAFHSITYDKFMGGHFFDRIVATCLEKHPSLSKEDFCRPCREEFARLLPQYATYFPSTVWYFSEVRDRYNKPLYQDTGISPEWRP